jgi:hypothetical protein
MTGPRIFRSDAAVVMLVLGALVATGLLLIVPGVYFSQWSQDLFIPLEGVLHLRAGQWPHRDFMTPVGSGWYWINALPTYLLPIGARTLIEANLLVALTAAALALWVALPRLPRWLAGLTAFYIGMLALSPRQIGEGYAQITNIASYNRHCWALIAVIALAALLPDRTPRHDRRDGVIVGVLIAACFYIKITYAAVGCGFVGLALITTRGLAGWRFSAWAAGAAAALVALIGVATGDLPGYFADMRTAVAVLPDVSRHDAALYLLVMGAPGLAMSAALGVLAAARTDCLINWRDSTTWTGSITAFVGLVISLQNHPEPENPLLPVALLLAWQSPRLFHPGPFRFSNALGLSAIVIGICLTLNLDCAAVYRTSAAPVDHGPVTRWLAETHVPDMRFGTAHVTAGAFDSVPLATTDVQTFRRWQDAADLLQPHLKSRHDAIVLPFAWSNPIPLLLDLPPVRHEVAWWDWQRTFNPTHRPDPHALLDAVDFVMVPNSAALIPHDFVPFQAPQMMWAAYGATVQHDFSLAGHSEFWDLWVRKDCSRRDLC